MSILPRSTRRGSASRNHFGGRNPLHPWFHPRCASMPHSSRVPALSAPEGRDARDLADDDQAVDSCRAAAFVSAHLFLDPRSTSFLSFFGLFRLTFLCLPASGSFLGLSCPFLVEVDAVQRLSPFSRLHLVLFSPCLHLNRHQLALLLRPACINSSSLPISPSLQRRPRQAHALISTSATSPHELRSICSKRFFRSPARSSRSRSFLTGTFSMAASIMASSSTPTCGQQSRRSRA